MIKSEPFVYSFADLEKEGSSMWEGVRNYQARNNLRAMKKGDLTLFYHSREGLEVVGIAKVIREHYPDPTADSGDWSVVEFAPVRRLANPVTLKTIKADPALQDILLVRNGRISVMPLEAAEYQRILDHSEGKV